MEPTKFLLDEKALPETWYNLVPDLPFGLDPPTQPGEPRAGRARGVRPDLPARDHSPGGHG
jgi:tryptophan synthase beta chain